MAAQAEEVNSQAVLERLRAKEFLDPKAVAELVSFAKKVAPPMGDATTQGAGEYFSDHVAVAGQKFIGPFNPSKVSTKIKQKMLLTPQVALAFAAAVSPIQTVRFTLWHHDEKLKARVEQTVFRPLRRWLISHFLDSVALGHAVDEILWDRGPQKYKWQEPDGEIRTASRDTFYVNELKDLNPEGYKFIEDEMGHLLGITQKAIVQTVGDIVPLEKLLHYTYGAKYGNPWGTGRLENIYEVWYWHQVVSLFCNQYFERRAIPQTVVYVDPSEAVKDPTTGARASDVLRSVAQGFQRQIRGNVVIALWSVYDQVAGERIWDVKTLEGDQRAAMFVEYLTYLDTKIFRGLLVPERAATQDTSVGTNSMAQTHAGLMIDLANHMLGGLLEVINKQLLPRWAKYNGIDEELVADATNINKAASNLQAQVITALLKLEESLLTGGRLEKTTGLLMDMIDRAALCEEAGLRIHEDSALGRYPKEVETPEPVAAPGAPEASPSGEEEPEEDDEEGEEEEAPESASMSKDEEELLAFAQAEMDRYFSAPCRQKGESSQDCRKRKIAEMIREGKKKDQAVAVAYQMCSKTCKQKKGKK